MKKFAKISKVGISLAIIATLCGGCSFRSIGQSINGATSSTNSSTTSESIYTPSVEEKVNAINDLIDENFYFDASDDKEREEYIYKGILESLDDPYSVYYTADEYADLMNTSTGSYEGIGVSIQQDVKTKTLTVIRVFQGSGAEEAGMLPKDIIREEVSEVVTWIKGEPGTTVDVTVYRPSTDEELTLTIERKTIDNPTVSYKMRENQIGYIEVTDFYEKTAEQFEKAIDDLQGQGMKSLIVDLRNNPGGYVDVVVEMCNYILKEGTIVYTKDRDGNVVSSYEADGDHSLDIPMVVLVYNG